MARTHIPASRHTTLCGTVGRPYTEGGRYGLLTAGFTVWWLTARYAAVECKQCRKLWLRQQAARAKGPPGR